MTYFDFEKNLYENILPKSDRCLRNGQIIMIHLHNVWKKQYLAITGTKYDCFYTDKTIPETMEYLKSIWHTFNNP
jgi:hypothetical protein